MSDRPVPPPPPGDREAPPPGAFSDSQLSAWLDGELTPEDQARAGAWLATHPDAARRVAGWRADQEALRDWVAAWPDNGPATHQPTRPPKPAPPRSLPLAWAAGLALLCAGLGVGVGRWWGADWRSQDTAVLAQTATGGAPWWQRASAAHAVYGPEQGHPVEVDVRGTDAAARAAQERHLAAWLTKRVAVPVALFDLQDLGFELMGGRLLPDGGQPGAQLMYQRADGRRVTVFLRRPETTAPASFRYVQDGPRGLFYWVDGSVGYALVGDGLARTELLALAEHIHTQATRAMSDPSRAPRP